MFYDNLSFKIFFKIFLAYFFFFCWFGFANAATISSTTNGGNWTNSSTWELGIIPGENDDVIINSKVLINSPININNTIITNSGTLSSYRSTDILTVTGDFENNGELLGYLKILGNTINNNKIAGGSITSEGGIINNGDWSSTTLNLSGTGTRVFNFDNGSSRANIKLQSDIEFSGNIEGNTFYQNEYNVNAEEGIISVNDYYGKTTDGINGKVGLINIGEEGFPSRLYYDINAGVLKINGKATVYSKMNLDGDLFIGGSGILSSYSSTYILTATGNFENNGELLGYLKI